jgi:hypothetical protein
MNELSLFSTLESLYNNNTPQKKLKTMSKANECTCPLFATECAKLENSFVSITKSPSVTMALAADAANSIEFPNNAAVESVMIEEVLLPLLKNNSSSSRWLDFKRSHVSQTCRSIDKKHAFAVMISALLFVSMEDEKTWTEENPLDLLMPADHIRTLALLVLVADFAHPILSEVARDRLLGAVEAHGGHCMQYY